ncbi:MAG: prolipoprotein diacylglyceryl transferase [Chakrabartia sp.]
MILASIVDATSAVRWQSLGLDPVALDLGFFKVRWYSLAYITGILVGWWYLTKLVTRPGAPMTKAQVEDLVIYATLGIILGGRFGYIFFYRPEMLGQPLSMLKLWEGGMSFHGGVIGVVLGMLWFARAQKVNWLRTLDYLVVVYPIGHFLGRLANFVNGELWGRETTVPWGMVFPGGGDVVRHPSQLYQAGLEGLVLGIILSVLFWKSDSRLKPGALAGHFVFWMGGFRFVAETVREPDVGVHGLLGMTMGQTLCVPMILLGLYLILTAQGRRDRADASDANTSIA